MKNSVIFIDFFTLLILGCSPEQSDDSQLPNILIIYADDLGYGDVKAYNPDRGKIPTPNIDLLAANLRFTDRHSSSGMCTPSRYSILTWRYHWRTKRQRGVLNGFSKPLIAPGHLTLAGLAGEHGYATACIGKWHLYGHGKRNNVEPERRQDFQLWQADECCHTYDSCYYYEHDDPKMKYWKGMTY